MIVHPDFTHLSAVESMDRAKAMRQGQKRDCLAAIAKMQQIRQQVRLKTGNIDIAQSKNVEFIGYRKIPTWTGFIGDDVAYVSPYFSRTDTSDLNAVIAKRSDEWGAPLPFFAGMLKDLVDIRRDEEGSPSLWAEWASLP